MRRFWTLRSSWRRPARTWSSLLPSCGRSRDPRSRGTRRTSPRRSATPDAGQAKAGQADARAVESLQEVAALVRIVEEDSPACEPSSHFFFQWSGKGLETREFLILIDT